ncbi:MAG: metallophosphoesterase [Actinomycetota bacterium]|nr:metallophosphoesterase [Actinomycetota bacterium]
MDEPPRRPQNDTQQELGFTRRPMVRWFDPGQLIQTGVRTVVSGVFGTYADKREMQAALGEAEAFRDLAGATEPIWIDYVADLGDGWESTYTIAYLLSRETLTAGGVATPLPRGHVLLMGGDQVYPTASREEYENRLIGPYRAALPWVEPAKAPYLFAIPGNHDWYDGLTNFIRFFCRGEKDKWIGGWKLAQRRSYFAIQLPHRWWLWGVDVQFDVYIDEPQLEFFRGVAASFKGDERVILVTGKPSWQHGTDEPNRSYDNVRFLEEKIIEPKGRLVVSLSGDTHHYARYEEETTDARKRQKLTSGGGGAALSGTHHLDDPLPLKRHDQEHDPDAEPTVYRLRERYPGPWASRLLTFAVPLGLPIRNPTFLVGVFAFYLVPAILLQPPVRRELGDDGAGFLQLWDATLSSKWTLYAALAIVPALIAFAAARSIWWRIVLGAVHGAVHVVLLSAAVAAAGWLLGGALARGLDLAVAALGAFFATFVGPSVVGLYLLLCDLLRGKQLSRHAGEVYAALRIEDRKNFLRMKIGADGTLTIYPIGVERVARTEEMQLVPESADPGAAWFELPDASTRAKLLEPEPIDVV